MKTAPLFILQLLRMASLSLIISAVFILLKWIASLLSISDPPTWLNFWAGAAAIFVLWFICSVAQTIITFYRFSNDPAFKEAHLRTGISWRTYKHLKKRNSQKGQEN